MGETLSVPVELDGLWMEIDASELSGLPKAEGTKRSPQPSFQGPCDRIADGTGESEALIHARALSGIESLIIRGDGHYLVASHGMILNAAVHAAFGVPIPANHNGLMRRFSDTGHMDLAYYRGIHRWRLLGVTNV